MAQRKLDPLGWSEVGTRESLTSNMLENNHEGGNLLASVWPGIAHCAQYHSHDNTIGRNSVVTGWGLPRPCHVEQECESMFFDRWLRAPLWSGTSSLESQPSFVQLLPPPRLFFTVFHSWLCPGHCLRLPLSPPFLSFLLTAKRWHYNHLLAGSRWTYWLLWMVEYFLARYGHLLWSSFMVFYYSHLLWSSVIATGWLPVMGTGNLLYLS